MTIQTINPATGQVIKEYIEMSDHTLGTIIEASHSAHLQWQQLSIQDRAKYMATLANLLNDYKLAYARLMAEEMGKPLSQGMQEIEKCALLCYYYIDHAATFLTPTVIKTEMSKSYVTYQPLGVIFAIMPWNFPFWQVFRFAIPTLMAGNGVILKHAPISIGTSLAIEQLFFEANFPENLFRSLIINDSQAKQVINHKKIAGISLTGSRKAGKIVGMEAAQALKKIVLELGGSDPYIILADADLENAAEVCVSSRMKNTGQVCIAAKRLIVVESVKEKFLQLILQEVKKYCFGNPLDREVNLGPLARKDLRDTVHQQVTKSITQGDELLIGGTIPNMDGFYYPPTILNNVQPNMPAYEEEIFGPVITVINAKNTEHAIKIANDTLYGLGAAIFTRNIELGEDIAVNKIQAGTCAINTFVSSDPRLPFGGIKESGYGRELSIEGMLSFVNIKSIHIK